MGIMATEAITGILLLLGGVLGIRSARTHSQWAYAQRWTYVGSVTGLLVFFFGFIVVGGNWFIMYLNSKWNGLEPAFQNSVITLLMLILVTGVLVGSQLSSKEPIPPPKV